MLTTCVNFSKKIVRSKAVPGADSYPRVICAATCHSSLVKREKTAYTTPSSRERKEGCQRNDADHVADPHWPRDLRLHVLKEFRVDLQDGCSVAILRELLHFEILAELLGQNGHLLLLNQLSNVRREVVHDRAAGSAYGQLCVAPPGRHSAPFPGCGVGVSRMINTRKRRWPYNRFIPASAVLKSLCSSSLRFAPRGPFCGKLAKSKKTTS